MHMNNRRSAQLMYSLQCLAHQTSYYIHFLCSSVLCISHYYLFLVRAHFSTVLPFYSFWFCLLPFVYFVHCLTQRTIVVYYQQILRNSRNGNECTLNGCGGAPSWHALQQTKCVALCSAMSRIIFTILLKVRKT